MRRLKKKPFRPSKATPANIKLPPYTPASPQAKAFHECKKPIKALFGGDRAAKSGTVAYEQVCRIRENPKTLHWCVCLTQEKIYSIWQWYKVWLAPHEYKVVGWYRQGEDIPSALRHKNGCLLKFKTAKSGPGAFSADKVRSCVVDEDPQRATPQGETIWNDILSRTLQGGEIFLAATPILGKNWMYYRVHLKNLGKGKTVSNDIESWNVSLRDNIFVSDRDKDRALANMSEDEIQRRFYGMFTTLTGAVFKEWNEDRHVEDFDGLPADIRKCVSIDLGNKHPFVALYGGMYDEKLYVWSEYYNVGATTKQHAEDVLLLESDYSHFRDMLNLTLRETRVCDWERQTRVDLESFGVWTEPANKDVDRSLDLLNTLMKEDRLVIHPRCTQLVRTVPMFHWRPQRAGADEKEQVVKEDDDAVDALRYLAMYFFGEGTPDYEIMTG